ERPHHIDEFGMFGVLAVDAALLARLDIGGERFAAFLDHAGDVPGEFLQIEGRALFRRGCHVGASINFCSASANENVILAMWTLDPVTARLEPRFQRRTRLVS